MNCLAHLALGGKEPAGRVGNLLGDFVKGTEESLRKDYPDAVVDGMMVHREIDKFTDSHPDFHKAKSLLPAELQRYAGIIIDIYFDHFLAKNWSKFSSMPLESYADESIKMLEDHIDILPERLKSALTATDHLVDDYEEYEKLFFSFYPQLRKKFEQAAIIQKGELGELNTTDSQELLKIWAPQAYLMVEKGLMEASVVTFYQQKGVEKSLAEVKVKELAARAKEEKAKRGVWLYRTGVIFSLLSPAFILSHFTPYSISSLSGNILASLMMLGAGMFIITKSQTID